MCGGPCRRGGRFGQTKTGAVSETVQRRRIDRINHPVARVKRAAKASSVAGYSAFDIRGLWPDELPTNSRGPELRPLSRDGSTSPRSRQPRSTIVSGMGQPGRCAHRRAAGKSRRMPLVVWSIALGAQYRAQAGALSMSRARPVIRVRKLKDPDRAVLVVGRHDGNGPSPPRADGYPCWCRDQCPIGSESFSSRSDFCCGYTVRSARPALFCDPFTPKRMCGLRNTNGWVAT